MATHDIIQKASQANVNALLEVLEGSCNSSIYLFLNLELLHNEMHILELILIYAFERKEEREMDRDKLGGLLSAGPFRNACNSQGQTPGSQKQETPPVPCEWQAPQYHNLYPSHQSTRLNQHKLGVNQIQCNTGFLQC